MIVRISVRALEELNKNAPPGYYEHITSGGTVHDGALSIESSAYIKLWERYKVGAEPTSLKPGEFPSRQQPMLHSRSRMAFAPGTLFSIVIKLITGADSSRCGRCAQRVRQMNQWGWWKSWLNRKIIVTWLSEEARRRGHQITDSSVHDLLKAAFRELRRQRPGKPSAVPLQSQ